MSLAKRWVGPFAGAAGVLGAVVGFVIVGANAQQVPVPGAAEIHSATVQDDEPSGAAAPSPPFTVVYPKRSVDVVEVPGADDEAGRPESGDGGLPGGQPQSQPSTTRTSGQGGGDGGSQAKPTPQVTPAPTRSAAEGDDSHDAQPSLTPGPTATGSPRPSWTPTGSPSQTRSPRPSWSDEDERDRTTTPGP